MTKAAAIAKAPAWARTPPATALVGTALAEGDSLGAPVVATPVVIQVPVPEAVGPTVEVELETDQRGVSEEEVVGTTTEVVVTGSTVVVV